MTHKGETDLGGEPTGNSGGDPVECTGCGVLAYPDDRYCACCGTTLYIECPRCRARILHPIARFCTSCGAGLGGTTAPDA